MNCQEVQKILSLYHDGALEGKEANAVQSHLNTCSACQNELNLFQKSWDMLGSLKEIEPKPGYVSRFWTELSFRTPWYERLRLVSRLPAFAAVTAVVIVGFLTFQNIQETRYIQEQLALLNPEEVEIVENMELAQHMDVIENIELLEDMDVLENLDILES